MRRTEAQSAGGQPACEGHETVTWSQASTESRGVNEGIALDQVSARCGGWSFQSVFDIQDKSFAGEQGRPR